MKQYCKRIGFVIGLLATLLIIAWFLHRDETLRDLLNVHILDVGQGDAVYIESPSGESIVIDGGPDASILYRLGRIMPFYDMTIDILVLTHPHHDHMSGLFDVIKKYRVQRMYYGDTLLENDEFLALKKHATVFGIELVAIPCGSEHTPISLGDRAQLEFIMRPCETNDDKNINNMSVVTRLMYGQIRFLFTGDIEQEVEERLLSSGLDLSADVLKVAHHGSVTSSIESFVAAVNPRIAIVSVGEHNRFEHPSPRVLKRFQRRGVIVYRTDQDGTVTMVTDGVHIGKVEKDVKRLIF